MSVMVGRERGRRVFCCTSSDTNAMRMEIDGAKLRSAYSLLFLVMCAIGLGVRRRHICQRAILMLRVWRCFSLLQ
jgi:hypothetical protein